MFDRVEDGDDAVEDADASAVTAGGSSI